MFYSKPGFIAEMINNAGKWVIFDFDGTLADTISAGIVLINSFAKKYNFKEVTPEDLPVLRTKTSREILQAVGLSVWKVPFLARDVRNKFLEQIAHQKLFPGMLETLGEIKTNGYHLAILTTNSEENVKLFLGTNQLESFDFIYSEKSLFGKGKVLKNLLIKYAINSDDVIYVGDETRDIEAAHTASVKSIAVTWGVNSADILAKQNPDFLANNPGDIKNWLSLQRADS